MLNVKVRNCLNWYLETVRPAFKPKDGERHVFLGRSGKPIARNRAVQKAFDQIGTACGVEFTPHTLRHTFGKRLVDAGRPLTEVAALLGHESISTTEIYTKPGLEDLEKAVDSLV
jgi:integrase/recombinase XerC